MIPFPHYTQLDQMDCGSTCLRMVAKYHGRSFTAQSLREKAQIGRDGVSMLGIAEAADAIGFRSVGVKITYEQLVKEAPLPCVVHWGKNHFVVVYAISEYGKTGHEWFNKIKSGFKSPLGNDAKPYGRTQLLTVNQSTNIGIPLNNPLIAKDENYIGTSPKDKIYVADPAKGLVTFTAREFCDSWLSIVSGTQNQGTALLFELTPAFYAQEDEVLNNYSFERVLRYIWQYKRLLTQLLIGLAVGSVLQLIFPFLTQSIIDVGVNTRNIPFIYLVLAAQLMLVAGRLSVEFIQSRLLLYVSTRVNINILSDFLIKLMRLPLSFFDTKRFGDIIQRIGDHHRVENFVMGQSLSMPFALINIGALSFVVAYYSLPIFSVYVVGNLLYGWWIILFLKQRRELDMKRFDLSAKNQSMIVGLIQGMQDIKLAGAERYNRWEWERLQARLFRLQLKSLSLGQFQKVGGFVINDGKNVIITFLAAQAVINGQLTLGAMLAMQQIIGQLNNPISQLIGFSQSFQDAKISLERLNEIHSLTDEEPYSIPMITRLSDDRRLILRNVTFTYIGAGNEPVLRDINLCVLAGKTTAIVGTSGSGKTTLLKLLLRFYEPTHGDICIGETALCNVGHSYWRSQCGVVMQDGFIFSDSIARNIAVGEEHIDVDRLDHAIRVANLREFIESLPSGLHTTIGADGNGISQGQRQRILIARVVYKDPHYIFFDEATNSLDATNETLIMKNLEEFFVGRTVIIVAHRLSTVYKADQIAVLNKSMLTELGTHTELVAKRGEYWQLVRNQLELNA